MVLALATPARRLVLNSSFVMSSDEILMHSIVHESSSTSERRLFLLTSTSLQRIPALITLIVAFPMAVWTVFWMIFRGIFDILDPVMK